VTKASGIAAFANLELESHLEERESAMALPFNVEVSY
jgi:hypothetical protein